MAKRKSRANFKATATVMAINDETTNPPGQVEETDLPTEQEPIDPPKEEPLPDEPIDPNPPVLETRYGVITNARYVNVRKEPNPTSEVLKVAEEGERVIILYEDRGYYKVEFVNKIVGFISSEFVKEIHGGINTDKWFSKSESILTSVKKLLGIEEECEEFDLDIAMNINSAMATLRQLGIGPQEGFFISNKNATYEDYLGDNQRLIPQVKMYLFYKTKLGFDPPASSTVMECIKQMIAEVEWRLNVQVDPGDAFDYPVVPMDPIL